MIAEAANLLHSHIVNPTTPPATSITEPAIPANRPAPPWPAMVEAHVGDGEYEASKVYAYVYLEQVVHSPHLFIRQACGAPAFHLAASSRGIGIMVFRSHAERGGGQLLLRHLRRDRGGGLPPRALEGAPGEGGIGRYR